MNMTNRYEAKPRLAFSVLFFSMLNFGIVSLATDLSAPYIRAIPSAYEYDETTTNNTGVLNLFLSESFSEDVWVRLSTVPAVQSNIVFSTESAIRIEAGNTNATVGIRFSVSDGTLSSETLGVTIIPSLASNANAAAFFTDLRETSVFVKNVRPTVTVPVARDLSLVPIPQYTNVAMGRPFSFAYAIKDVTADASSMLVTWTFGDGSSAVVTGAVGSVSHTYANRGTMFLSVQAIDKDGGQSDLIEFPVSVVSPPPPPAVRIQTPTSAFYETSAPNTGSFMVQLSEASTNIVTVDLAVSPTNSPANGAIVLNTNRVVFAVGETDKVVRFSARDGSDTSWMTGFTVTPSVVGNAAARDFFLDLIPGTVEIGNIAPVIQCPPASDTSGPAVYQVVQGMPTPFTWMIGDVASDLLSTPIASAMTVTWYFGDSAVQTGYGGSGSINHTYAVTGDVIVRMTAIDKDGGYSEVKFKITVVPSKAVNVTPLGPNTEASYYGAMGLGNGMVVSSQANSGQNINNVYLFKYSQSASSATFTAVPYKTAPLGYYCVTNHDNSGVAVVNTTPIIYDSFFFTWAGAEQGLAAQNLDPATATSSAVVSLAESEREIQAVFSREYRVADNMGDINQDGIPDKIAISIESRINARTNATTALPVGLTNLANYNQDVDDEGRAVGDYLPVNPAGVQGRFDFRPVSDGKGGNDFTAFTEVRGFDVGLNMPGFSAPDGVFD